MAAERRAEGRFRARFVPPVLAACCFDAAADPRRARGTFTPARRAFDRPMAMACLLDRAPCLPSRTWCISSWMNSPAWVDGDFPSRLSRRARAIVAFSGISPSLAVDGVAPGRRHWWDQSPHAVAVPAATQWPGWSVTKTTARPHAD